MNILRRILRWWSFRSRNIRVWQHCNVYPSAQIGRNVNIGSFTEIGPNVVIGNDVRIGAYCFIPEGVIIGDGAWIGPRVTFSNDLYPPSEKVAWKRTFVGQGVSVGASVSILPGVVIGDRALIGMGSVVTKHVPGNEIWAGVPARHKRKYEPEVDYGYNSTK